MGSRGLVKVDDAAVVESMPTARRLPPIPPKHYTPQIAKQAEAFFSSVAMMFETRLKRTPACGVHDRVEFRVADANEAIPFPDESFDALFCNDSIYHLRDRRCVLADWYRVLRSGGRCLYTDPIVVTRCLSNAEIETRSSIGFCLFTPEGVNESLVRAAGFGLMLVADVTDSVSRTSQLSMRHDPDDARPSANSKDRQSSKSCSAF